MQSWHVVLLTHGFCVNFSGNWLSTVSAAANSTNSTANTPAVVHKYMFVCLVDIITQCRLRALERFGQNENKFKWLNLTCDSKRFVWMRATWRTHRNSPTRGIASFWKRLKWEKIHSFCVWRLRHRDFRLYFHFGNEFHIWIGITLYLCFSSDSTVISMHFGLPTHTHSHWLEHAHIRYSKFSSANGAGFDIRLRPFRVWRVHKTAYKMLNNDEKV